MSTKQNPNVTMRVRVGDAEIEVTGPADFVEAKIAEFVDKFKSATPVRLQSPTLTKEPVGTAAVKSMSIGQFMKRVSAKTDVDKALAAGYYLEKHENAEKFTAADIRTTIKGAKMPPPKNPNDAINKNIKKGYIMAAGDKDGKMGYVLTTDGEQAIDDSLSSAE